MENNPIIIEHETSELYRVYKGVKSKVDVLKDSYVDLAKKVNEVAEVYATEKTKLTEVVAFISSEKLAWASEKANGEKIIELKTAELDSALKIKEETDKKLQEIQDLVEKEIEVRNETRQLELKVKADQDIVNSDKRAVEIEREALVKYEKEIENKEKAFKDKIINLVKEL